MRTFIFYCSLSFFCFGFVPSGVNHSGFLTPIGGAFEGILEPARNANMARTIILKLLMSKIECNSNINLSDFTSSPYIGEQDEFYLKNELKLLSDRSKRLEYYWPKSSDSILFGSQNELVSVERIVVDGIASENYAYYSIDIATVNFCMASRRVVDVQYSPYPQICPKPHALIYDSRFVIGIPYSDTLLDSPESWIYLGRDFCSFEESKNTLEILCREGNSEEDTVWMKKFILIDAWADYQPTQLRFFETKGKTKRYKFYSGAMKATYVAEMDGHDVTYFREETSENLEGLVLSVYEARFGPQTGAKIDFVKQEKQNFTYRIEATDGKIVTAIYSKRRISFVATN